MTASSTRPPDGGHGEKKRRVIEKLAAHFERFFGLGGSRGDHR